MKLKGKQNNTYNTMKTQIQHTVTYGMQQKQSSAFEPPLGRQGRKVEEDKGLSLPRQKI